MESVTVPVGPTFVESPDGTPLRTRLEQNYPNPFNSQTDVSFELANDGWVDLTLYDPAGREVLQLISGQRSAGRHSVLIDASRLASGVYLIRLHSGSGTLVKKMVLLR